MRKKHVWKRGIAVTLAGMLAVGMTGCGSSGGGKETEAPKKEEAVTQAEQKAETEKEESKAETGER